MKTILIILITALILASCGTEIGPEKMQKLATFCDPHGGIDHFYANGSGGILRCKDKSRVSLSDL